MAGRGIFAPSSILEQIILKENQFPVLGISLSTQELPFINLVLVYFWQFIYLFLPKKFYHILIYQKNLNQPQDKVFI